MSEGKVSCSDRRCEEANSYLIVDHIVSSPVGGEATEIRERTHRGNRNLQASLSNRNQKTTLDQSCSGGSEAYQELRLYQTSKRGERSAKTSVKVSEGSPSAIAAP